MTDQSSINVGIAGLGRTGWNNHANAFAHLPEQFRVVAVCDPDPERQAEAIERFDCLAYGSYEELVADKAVELMVVATPSNLHAAQTIAAMRAGQHVIVEKPMASDLAGRRRDARRCQRDRTDSDRSSESALRCRLRQGAGGDRPPAFWDASSRSASTTAASTAGGIGRR